MSSNPPQPEPDDPGDSADPNAADAAAEPLPEAFRAADDNGDVTWQPPRGPITRIVAWVILIMMALGLLVMLLTALR